MPGGADTRREPLVPTEVFIDAGAWIAIALEPDRYHAAAARLYAGLLRESRPLVTTNLVVAEAYIGIRRHGGYALGMRFLQSLRQSPRLLRVYSDPALEEQAEEILRRYANQDFSLVDAVSIAVMRQRKISEAFAFDQHFATAGLALVPDRR